MVAIYYFDKPNIGYCPSCDVLAVYRDGLVCPSCRIKNLSYFVWDGESRHPENTEGED